MKYHYPLQAGILNKRYKRFLADIETADGQQMTVHCPNTGAMTTCAEPGSRIWVWDSLNDKRKYRFTWELVEVADKYLACINTHRANELVYEAIKNATIEPLKNSQNCAREVKYNNDSRVDFLLTGTQRDCYVEVKSVTWWQGDGLGIFPDAITERGQKHLLALIDMVKAGHRAVLLFCVQHTGITKVQAAVEKDPVYAATLVQAIAAGVEVYAFGVHIDTQQIYIDRQLEFLAP